MASTKEIRVSPRVEEILIGSAVGAACGLALAAPFVTGLPGYLPHDVTGLAESIRAGLAWIAPAVGAVAGGYYAAVQPRDTHLKGARYYPDAAEGRRVLQQQQRARYSPAQRKAEPRQVRGVLVGGVELARKTETEHLALTGLTGGGKTATLQSLIDQILARGDRAIIHDIKGDLAARYFDPATAVMLGPWDQRAALWDAATDIDSPERANEFAAAVCGVKAAQGTDAHWARSAANVLRGLIRSYMRDGSRWTWADLRDALAGDPVALVQRAAEGEPLVRSQFPSAFVAKRTGPKGGEYGPSVGKEGASILSTLAAKAGWLLSYAAVDAKDKGRARFSLRDWLTGAAHKDVRLVFLNYSALYSSACEQLFGALAATLHATIASPLMPETSADAPHATWLIFDEFPQMGAEVIAESDQIAALGRSKAVRMVIALQDETQLTALLGHEKAAPILTQQVTRIYLRCSPQTADAVCKRAGTRQVDRIETTTTNGATQGKTKHAVEEQVIRPDALTGLQTTPQGVEMVVHIGETLARLVQPYPEKREAIADAYTESPTWRQGSLPDGPIQAPEPALEPALAAVAAAVAAIPPPTFDDDLDDLTLDDPDEEV